ncbi:MAG: Bax inhibitor-1 family protein [Acidimicrobiales bacterium]|jgi:modulator of FtsH protease
MYNDLDHRTTPGGLRDAGETRSLFSQTMGYVAATVGIFALGTYLGRSLSYGWGWLFFFASFACLIAMRFAVRRTDSSAVGLLFAFGLLMGLATAPTVVYYSGSGPQVLWQAAGATALFMAGLGTMGYASRRDLSGIARVCFWALLALIVFGIVTIFAQIPNGSIIYSVVGLVIFAGLTMFDFQRLRVGSDLDSAPLLAASIFLDALNVFLFFLNIFNRRK